MKSVYPMCSAGRWMGSRAGRPISLKAEAPRVAWCGQFQEQRTETQLGSMRRGPPPLRGSDQWEWSGAPPRAVTYGLPSLEVVGQQGGALQGKDRISRVMPPPANLPTPGACCSAGVPG
ncbi:hypothetical protein ACOMHN_008336 [Nucella lapillus]